MLVELLQREVVKKGDKENAVFSWKWKGGTLLVLYGVASGWLTAWMVPEFIVLNLCWVKFAPILKLSSFFCLKLVTSQTSLTKLIFQTFQLLLKKFLANECFMKFHAERNSMESLTKFSIHKISRTSTEIGSFDGISLWKLWKEVKVHKLAQKLGKSVITVQGSH